MRLAVSAIALTALFAPCAIAQDFTNEPADGQILIEEWTVPYEESRPRDPFTADGETIWFVGQRSDYLASLNVETGEFEHVALQEGDGPHNQIVGPDGMVWIAGNRAAHIARYDAETGQFLRVDMPDGHPRDPHTLIFNNDGSALWFTAQGANTIGRLIPGEWAVDIIDVPTEGSRPYGITITPDGMVWVALLGTNKIASVNPETLQLTEYALPREGARPRRIGHTSDGRVWFVDYAEGFVGVFDPETNATQEWPAPAGSQSGPYAMAVDGQDRIWFVETGVEPNNFVGFDPATEEFFSQTPVPSGGGTVRHMQYYAPDGVIWFGADTNTIGRAVVEPQAE